MVDGGLAVAAFKRFWRDKSLSDLGEPPQDNESSSNESKKVRCRYTTAKRYGKLDDIKQLILDKQMLSATLLADKNTSKHAIVVEVGKSGSQLDRYELQFNWIIAYGTDLIYFGELQLQSTNIFVLEPNYEEISFVFLIPGRLLWPHEGPALRGGPNLQERQQLDELYTLGTDDYRVLQEDGSISEKNFSKSIWKRRFDDDEEPSDSEDE